MRHLPAPVLGSERSKHPSHYIRNVHHVASYNISGTEYCLSSEYEYRGRLAYAIFMADWIYAANNRRNTL